MSNYTREENINDERFAKWHEKLIYYRFYPTLEIWLSKKNDPSFNEEGTSKTIIIPSQTYYGGPWVNTGFFKYIKFKTFAIHIKFFWWQETFANNSKIAKFLTPIHLKLSSFLKKYNI